MADDADVAQSLSEFHEKIIINSVRMKVSQNAEEIVNCIDCGEEIPKARRVAYPGCELCIHCKEEQESGFWS